MPDEFDAMRDEIHQRSSMQHSYLITNVAIAGAIISFALTADKGVPACLKVPAMLCVPLVSCSLFMLWIHQALVIKHRGMYIESRLLPDGWESHKFDYFTGLGKTIMALCYSTGIFGVFIGIPLCSTGVAFILQEGSFVCPSALKWAAWVSIGLSVLIFALWFFDFYLRAHIAVREADKQDSGKDE